MWSNDPNFLKIYILNLAMISKAILINKHFLELSNRPLEELKSAILEREREKIFREIYEVYMYNIED